jgi:hypothetical protein
VSAAPHAVLGLPAAATAEEITRAYRKLDAAAGEVLAPAAGDGGGGVGFETWCELRTPLYAKRDKLNAWKVRPSRDCLPLARC